MTECPRWDQDPGIRPVLSSQPRPILNGTEPGILGPILGGAAQVLQGNGLRGPLVLHYHWLLVPEAADLVSMEQIQSHHNRYQADQEGTGATLNEMYAPVRSINLIGRGLNSP